MKGVDHADQYLSCYSVGSILHTHTHTKTEWNRYICEFCVVPLHRGRCFEKYHAFKLY